MHPTVLPDGTVRNVIYRRGDRQWGSAALIDETLVGPKGMKRVLQERGLWKEGIRKQCGAISKQDTGDAKIFTSSVYGGKVYLD